MSKILVLGGSGFIGSHLVDVLSFAGHEVTVLSRASARLHPRHPHLVTTVLGDYMNAGDLRAALVGKDIVVHLISATTPASSADDPGVDIQTNLLASVKLFEICVQMGRPKVVFASSGGSVYGDVDSVGAIDEWQPTLPFSPYAIGKLAVEHYLGFFAKKHHLRSVIARISNPYGTGQDPLKSQGVIPIFLRNIQAGRPITILGDGEMVRDYIYVEDLAHMLAELTVNECRWPVYNLGSGEGYSLNSVVRTMVASVGVEPKIEYASKPPTFVERIVLDTGRYSSEFETRPLVPLALGIRRVWEEMQTPAE